MQNLPAADGFAAIHDSMPCPRFFKFSDDFVIRARTEGDRAGDEFANAEMFVQRLRAADVLHIASRQNEPRDFIHAVGAQKRRECELHGVFIAAIHQPVVFPSGGVHENGMTAIKRQHGQLDFSAGLLPTPKIKRGNQDQNCRAPDSSRGREQPAAQRADENGVVNSDGEPRRFWHIEKCAGNFCGTFADPRHRHHEKPCAVIEQFRCPRQPVAADETAEIAHERERAERHGHNVRQRRYRAEQMEVKRRQRNRTGPGRNGKRKIPRQHPEHRVQSAPPARQQIVGQQRVVPQEPVGNFVQWRQHQADDEHDEK